MCLFGTCALVPVQNSGHVDDDKQFLALDVFSEMDGRRSRYSKEVLDGYREEDAGDLRGNQVNVLVEKMTAFNSLQENIEKRLKSDMLDEQFVKKNVMAAKIDPKVVMDLSIFKIGGWNHLQSSNPNCLNNSCMRKIRSCR